MHYSEIGSEYFVSFKLSKLFIASILSTNEIFKVTPIAIMLLWKYWYCITCCRKSCSCWSLLCMSLLTVSICRRVKVLMNYIMVLWLHGKYMYIHIHVLQASMPCTEQLKFEAVLAKSQQLVTGQKTCTFPWELYYFVYCKSIIYNAIRAKGIPTSHNGMGL